MKKSPAALAIPMATLLAGCAGSVATPTTVQGLSAERKASMHLADVSADAADGVQMGDTDFDTICQKVKTYIQSQSPAVLGSAAADSAMKMKVHFTRFDRGNAFARAMLAGLGQIRIEATVYLVDSAGQQAGQYEVSKDFSFGGIVGATTSVEDVEDGFAKSVAAIVKTNT